MPTTPTDHQRNDLLVGPDRIRFRLTSEQSDGEVTVCDVAIPPGGGPPALHRHDPFELYRVRSGELTFYVEDEGGAVRRTIAGPGKVVPIGPGLEHTVRNESCDDAEATVVFSPGETMERFARAAAELGRDGAPGQEEVLALAEAYGIEITRSITDALRSRNAADAGAPSTGFLTITRFCGDGDRLLATYLTYAGVMSGVGQDHGLIVHAAAKTAEGLLMVNLWSSKERSEAAAADPRRLGVIERIGISPGHVSREHHDAARIEVLGGRRMT